VSTAPKRVTIDARYLRTKHSGIGRYTEQFITHILKLDPELQLHLITHPESPAPFGEAHPRITYTVFNAPANSISTRASLAKIVHRTNPDLYHSPFNFLPANLQVPSIFTLHDIMWLIHPEYCTSSRARRLVQGTFYQHVLSHSLHEASQVMTVSHYSKKDIETHYPHTKGRVHVSYNGLDPYFHPMAPHKTWETISHLVPPRRKFVLVVGQGSPYKNHIGALEGFLEAFADDPQIYLVMVRRFSRGTAPRLKQLLRSKALNSRLITLDYVSVEELRALYNAASCFLFPSIYEGFGIPPLEAMACGTPVVASNIGAPAEVCGEAAELVDPYDYKSIAHGLKQVIYNPSQRDLRIQLGLEHVKKFTWEQCASQVLNAYTSTLHAQA